MGSGQNVACIPAQRVVGMSSPIRVPISTSTLFAQEALAPCAMACSGLSFPLLVQASDTSVCLLRPAWLGSTPQSGLHCLSQSTSNLLVPAWSKLLAATHGALHLRPGELFRHLHASIELAFAFKRQLQSFCLQACIRALSEWSCQVDAVECPAHSHESHIRVA